MSRLDEVMNWHFGALDSMGVLDPRFGDVGWMRFDYTPFIGPDSDPNSPSVPTVSFESIQAVDGGFLVAVEYVNRSEDVSEYRLHNIDFDGIAVRDFAGGDYLRLPFLATSRNGIQLELGPDNSIYLFAGNTASTLDFQPYVHKFTPTGEPDTQFADGGVLDVGSVTSRSSPESRVLRVQQDGRIAVVFAQDINRQQTQVLVARFNSDGSVDRTFDEDGVSRLPVSQGYASEQPRDLRIDVQGVVLDRDSGDRFCANRLTDLSHRSKRRDRSFIRR